MAAGQSLATLSSLEAVQAQLRKILESRTFGRSGRLRAFLEYVVREAMREPGAGVKEYHIGVQVFHRQDSFDPRFDSIVRVQARRLRSKLRLYYSSEGSGDPIEIRIPVGRYTPSIRTRSDSPVYPARQSLALHPSVALLPFGWLGASEDVALAGVLAEDIANAIARSHRNIRLLAWHSGFLQPVMTDFRSIAERFDLDAIVRGSIRRSQDSTTISIELLELPDGRLLWSKIYDFPPAAPLRADLAARIVEELSLPDRLESHNA